MKARMFLQGVLTTLMIMCSVNIYSQRKYVTLYIPAYSFTSVNSTNSNFEIDSLGKQSIFAGQFVFKGDVMVDNDFVFGVDLTGFFNRLLKGRNVFSSTGKPLGSFGTTHGSLLYFRFGIQKNVDNLWSWGITYNLGMNEFGYFDGITGRTYISTGFSFLSTFKIGEKLHFFPKLTTDFAFLSKKTNEVKSGYNRSLDLTFGYRLKENIGISISPILQSVGFVFGEGESRSKAKFSFTQFQIGIAKML